MATRDRPQLLVGLLDALTVALRPGDEILVVDSASRDDATVRLCTGRGVPVLRLAEPGTSRARNAGWRSCSTPLVAFTDDDCLPQPGWATALATALADADFVTGRVLADRPVAAPVSLLVDVHGRALSATDLVGHGANCGFSREMLQRTAGFDERLGPGTTLSAAEDADLLRRAVQVGGRGRYEPAALVVHRQWRSRSQSLRMSFSYGLGSAGAAVHRGAPVRAALRTAAWDEGLCAAARDTRAGYPTGAVAGLLRATGAVAGVVRAARR